jgi:hypothetical protein
MPTMSSTAADPTYTFVAKTDEPAGATWMKGVEFFQFSKTATLTRRIIWVSVENNACPTWLNWLGEEVAAI